jgi:hypothetical protein
MCTVVILRRPGHDWPLILAANRDEMTGRPWRPPARHWPEREHVTAGIDELAGGTWLALGDDGVIAGVLNRPGSLGPDAKFRSRGELPLEAVDHAEASVAAEALSQINESSYRPFNMIIADAADAFWMRADANGIRVQPVPEGLSMITAHDLNDAASPRMKRYRPLFDAAGPPDPGNGDWSAWQALMADRFFDDGAGPGGAMNVSESGGFATVSSSLLALPARTRFGVKPVWLFAPGSPDAAAYEAIKL